MAQPVKAVLIAGPTASGKSALAVAVARATGGRVVNADSQQVYAGWRVLTARPSPEEEAAVEHRLYGHVPLGEAYSVGRWLREVASLPEGPIPVIVGGTGLYFRALTQGLAPIPAVPAEVRAEAEAELEALGLAAFAARLAERDPETAAVVDMVNPRRVLRAWEVLVATGTGLAAWMARTPPALMPLEECVAVALMPERRALYARCDARFDAMMSAGTVEEVRAVMALGLADDAPGMMAVGAAELMAWQRGTLSRDEAVARAKTETRRYAKRQMTWIRNQMGAWHHMAAPDPAAVLGMLGRRE